MADATEKAVPAACVEHRIPHAGGNVYVRDFPGDGPPFVLLHGFPDNGHIFDDLIPHLVAGGRRVLVPDFLGFGASDKPAGADYSFAQQLGDLEAVVDALGCETVIPVGHDAGGPAAVNFGLKHPRRTAAIGFMNAFYGGHPGLRVPEFIELFANRNLQALTRALVTDPQLFAWLLGFQRERLQAFLKDKHKPRYTDFLGPLIDDNFRRQPGAGPAFAQMTLQLWDEVAANTARLTALRASPVPMMLIWGGRDPYLHVSVAEDMRAQVRNAVLHVLDAGHWPQIDEAAEVARLLLTAG